MNPFAPMAAPAPATPPLRSRAHQPANGEA